MNNEETKKAKRGVKLVNAKPTNCRWPLWDTHGAPDFLVCGAPTSFGAYCEDHRVKVRSGKA